jgi:nucleotide-binding universal stress UspA family protein
MRLLLAVDGSPSSAPPVQAVVSRPWPPGSVVRVLSVVELPLPLGADLPIAPETQAPLRAQAEATLASVRDTVATGGLSVETALREGDAGREILEEAREWAADLVLMGSHGRTGLKRVLMGSVAQYVVSHAPCSVEVVRGPSAGGAAPAGNERGP